jgi:hypothetical protein
LGSAIVTFWFFKWFNNQEGTAGYVMVSATNERCQTSAERSIKPSKLSTSKAYFQSDIHRHVYFNGNATVGLADFSFEIDAKSVLDYH